MNLREEFETPVPAVVLAEGALGTTNGKTANGIVMHSEIFDVRAIVDSNVQGESPADVLGRPELDDVPITETVEAAVELAPDASVLVLGVAPSGGQLPSEWESSIERAMRSGCDVVSGLHVFLSDDPEWQALADDCGVTLHDVRKPDPDTFRVGDGRVDDADARTVLVMGTDCSIGKRTTTFELYREARDQGLDAGWVATGQTGIMIGAQQGVVIDRVPADFVSGVVEDLVCAVAEDHDIVFVEGQAALTHRSYSAVTMGILHGSWPDTVVLADDPGRTHRTVEPFMIAGVEKETTLIETASDAEVVALSTWGDPEQQSVEHGLPAANVYNDDGAENLLTAVLNEAET
jgi:uncharacterized NAD-dependent epimerase/dehydratase family protein